MTEVPDVRVRAVNLEGEATLALYDSRGTFELGIDFSRPSDEIATALGDLIREAVESGRWTRNGPWGRPPDPHTDAREVGPDGPDLA